MKGQVWLYFLTKNGKVVYIGVTQNVKTRLYLHKDKDYDSVRSFYFGNRYDALKYEKRWIIRFRPIYNTVYLFAWFGSNWDRLERINDPQAIIRKSKFRTKQISLIS